MKVLSEKMIRDEIEKFKDKLSRDGDWWFGKVEQYVDIPYGYDVNVFHEEEDEPFIAVVYQLSKPDEKGYLSITDEVIMKFEV